MLANQIAQDLVLAQKQRDELRLAVLRLVRSEIKNKEIAEKKDELDDAEIESILRKEAKKREESILQFRQGGREDLAKKEEQELEIIKKYLPEPLTDEQLQIIISQIISEKNFSSPSDFGLVMKEVMSQTHGRADGGKVSEFVKRELNKT